MTSSAGLMPATGAHPVQSKEPHGQGTGYRVQGTRYGYRVHGTELMAQLYCARDPQGAERT